MAFATRPVVRCRNGVVAAGHWLGAAAGQRLFVQGGNAIDAAAAASFALAVVEPHLNGLAGEVPILVHSGRDGATVAISGQGPAPAAMAIEALRGAAIDVIPGDGLLPATVPALVDAWAIALQRYGTKSLADVLAPAIELAEGGWPVQSGLARVIDGHRERFLREWPSTAAIFLPEGQAPRPGTLLRNPGLGRSLRWIADADAVARGGREERIEAGRLAFYAGPIAEAIDRHARTVSVPDASGRSHAGLLRLDDLRGYRGTVEAPITAPYRDTVVHKCPTWTQGAVFLQQLRLLEGFDLRRMGHNSADYLHTWIECAKLAFADREAWYGDPARAAVPIDRLLSVEHAAERRKAVDPRRASDGSAPVRASGARTGAGIGEPTTFLGDTTHVDAADRWGNLVAATPSGGWIPSSPVIEGLGFPLGTRGQMFSLDSAHPNALAPGKRPRSTLSPSLAYREGGSAGSSQGRPWLAFGTPGGDQQDQWTLQFFLNVVEFGMDLQAALDAPTVHTEHFPSSFYPREAKPKRVSAESRIDAAVLDELRRRGHDVVVPGPWEHGRVTACALETGGWLAGAASPRRETAYVMGW